MKVDRVKIITWSAVIILVAIFIVVGYKSNKEATQEALPIGYELSHDDSSVLSAESLLQLKVVEVYRSKVRNAISLCSYKDKYALVLYKVGSIGNVQLNKLVNMEEANSYLSSLVSYNAIGKMINYKLSYKAGGVPKVSDVSLTLAGDSIENIQTTKDVVAFRLHLKNASIEYSKTGKVDMLLEADGVKNSAINIAFFRSQGNLYFATLSPKDSSVPLNDEILTLLPK